MSSRPIAWIGQSTTDRLEDANIVHYLRVRDRARARQEGGPELIAATLVSAGVALTLILFYVISLLIDGQGWFLQELLGR